MRGGGIKLQTIANSPASAHLLDVTRTVSRAFRRPTGIDRIERAYITQLVLDPAPLFGVVRTKMGYLLLDKHGCSALLAQCETPIWHAPDLISKLSRRADADRGKTESGLRRIALDRSVPLRLTQMLKRHLPAGTVYLNIGQTNFNDRLIHALHACGSVRIAAYLHDTIPLDWPDVQTQKSHLAFKQLFARVDRHADLVLCNSLHTRTRILAHATYLSKDAVHVLKPGLPDMRIGTAPGGPWDGHPYFLAIGTIEPRKNIGFLLDLWARFSGPNDPHLILCGRRGWLNEDVFSRLDQKPPNVHEVPDLEDEAMWGLLQSSNGLLFPSLAEGFGFPALEAAQLGVPLICNPLPVFKELLDDYPIYAAESDCYAWRNKIEHLAQERWDQSGKRTRKGPFEAPTWQAHFNTLFTHL